MTPLARRTHARRQRGVILFIALIVLVAMSLGGLSLMRSVTGGMLATDNLRLQRGATISGDVGIERGRDIAVTGGTRDVANKGYYSSWTGFDPRTHDWDRNAVDVGTDTAGNRVLVVVHRMCKVANADISAAGQQCIFATTGGGPSSKLDGLYGQLPMQGGAAPYYRVTAKVIGAKNTVSYVQAMLGTN
jgi:Tfp pilus assembly protein PilX